MLKRRRQSRTMAERRREKESERSWWSRIFRAKWVTESRRWWCRRVVYSSESMPEIICAGWQRKRGRQREGEEEAVAETSSTNELYLSLDLYAPFCASCTLTPEIIFWSENIPAALSARLASNIFETAISLLACIRFVCRSSRRNKFLFEIECSCYCVSQNTISLDWFYFPLCLHWKPIICKSKDQHFYLLHVSCLL